MHKPECTVLNYIILIDGFLFLKLLIHCFIKLKFLSLSQNNMFSLIKSSINKIFI